MWDEIALLTISVLMLASGLIGQMKAPTLLGGSALVLYLMILIGSIVHRPQVAIGVYMMAGAALMFGAGVLGQRLPRPTARTPRPHRPTRRHLSSHRLAIGE